MKGKRKKKQLTSHFRIPYLEPVEIQELSFLVPVVHLLHYLAMYGFLSWYTPRKRIMFVGFFSQKRNVWLIRHQSFSITKRGI